MPEISPVVLMVALAGVPESHGSVKAAVPMPLYCVVKLMQTSLLPVIDGSALPVPVNGFVAVFVPCDVQVTVIVAFLFPAPEAVKVTRNVAESPAFIAVGALLTTNCASLETTVIPVASVPVFLIV